MYLYEILITNKNLNRTVSFIAESFSVTTNRILTIKSEKYGGVVTQIESGEELTIKELEDEDDYAHL